MTTFVHYDSVTGVIFQVAEGEPYALAGYATAIVTNLTYAQITAGAYEVDLVSVEGDTPFDTCEVVAATPGDTPSDFAARSASSKTIASSGSMSIVVQEGLLYANNMRVRMAAHSAPSNYMEGKIVSYSGSTLQFTVEFAAGEGTFDYWDVDLPGTVDANGWHYWEAGASSGPVMTPSAGSLESIELVKCIYKVQGDVCFYNFYGGIVDNGTGSGRLSVTLPIGSVVPFEWIINGLFTTGWVGAMGAIIGRVEASTMDLWKYDGSYPGANGRQFSISGSYRFR